jgi:hypothetical protein
MRCIYIYIQVTADSTVTADSECLSTFHVLTLRVRMASPITFTPSSDLVYLTRVRVASPITPSSAKVHQTNQVRDATVRLGTLWSQVDAYTWSQGEGYTHLHPTLWVFALELTPPHPWATTPHA